MPQPEASASASASVSTSSGAGEASRSAHAKTVVPVEYRVIDQPWSPSDPAVTGTMLNEQGQEGWRLINVYPDPIRERTRWIFSR